MKGRSQINSLGHWARIVMRSIGHPQNFSGGLYEVAGGAPETCGEQTAPESGLPRSLPRRRAWVPMRLAAAVPAGGVLEVEN